MKAAVAQLTPSQFPTNVMNAVGVMQANSNYVALNTSDSASGFQSQYQDSIDPNADQAHHFSAFFQLGYAAAKAGWSLTGIAQAAAGWWEKAEGTPNNTGDINLGQAAARMGAYLATGVLPVDQLAPTIQQNICKN